MAELGHDPNAVNLVTLTDPQSPAAEAYRALRMNLAFTSLDRELHTFVVTAPAAAGLASNAAANLAVVMAQTGQRVCLVDADLRRPSVHDLFHVAQEPGLTTLLVGHLEEQASPEGLFFSDSDVPNLSLLTSGTLPPNPADILGSNRMGELLDKLREKVDRVIFQAPPVTVALDASVLAAQTDGLILVVRTGHTRRDRIEQAKELLERFHVRLLGTVLTDAPDRGLLTGY